MNHAENVRNAIALEVTALCDAGTTNPNAQIILMTSTDDVVATLEMSNPAFDSSSVLVGTITANTITEDSNVTGGEVDKFKIVDRDGADVITGTVTAIGGGGDIEFSSVNFSAGDSAAINSMTYTAAS